MKKEGEGKGDSITTLGVIIRREKSSDWRNHGGGNESPNGKGPSRLVTKNLAHKQRNFREKKGRETRTA